MNKGFLTTFILCTVFYSFSQTTISRTLINNFTKLQIDSLLDANGIPSAVVNSEYGVSIYKLVYHTVSFDSSATVASGLFCVPNNTSCQFPLASYQHGTITKKNDAPSRFKGQEPLVATILASTGYVTLEPDYLGLGDSPGIHFYQHSQTEGTAVIDMIRAAREICDSLQVRLNGQIFLTGYSEGGHATMAAHRMIQEKVDSEMHVTASIPMSGAYSMSEVMTNVMLSDSTYPSPSYLGYLVTSWNVAYSLYDSLDKPLIYPYDSLMYRFFDGTHSTNYVDARMPSVPKTIFKPDTIAAFMSDYNHPFRAALRDNDVDNWLPTSPVTMLFCSSDHYVSDSNAFVAVTKMRALGCTQCDTVNINSTLDHQECAQYAIFYAKSLADLSAYVDCSTGIDERRAHGFSIFPNPASTQIEIKLPSNISEIKSIELVSMEGKVLSTETNLHSVNGVSLGVSNLSSGIYLVHITTADGVVIKNRFVKE